MNPWGVHRGRANSSETACREAGSLRVSLRNYLFFPPFLARKGARGMVEKGYSAPTYSSRVVISPGSKPSSSALSNRLIILPERVFGRLGVNSISAGVAIGPSSLRT